MARLPDEILMAYADGELDAAESANVEAALMESPEARERLRGYELTGRKLGLLFGDVVRQPVPQRLIETVRGAPVGDPRGQGSNGTGRRSMHREGAWSALFALLVQEWRVTAVGVLSATLMVGAAGGWLAAMRSLPADPDTAGLLAATSGGLIATGRLRTALDTAPSGQRLEWTRADGGASSIKIALTFRDSEQRYCREYRVDNNAGASGIACRAEEQWRLVVHGVAARPASPGGYAPATGGWLDTVVETMMAGNALGSDDELRLIGRGWRSE